MNDQEREHELTRLQKRIDRIIASPASQGWRESERRQAHLAALFDAQMRLFNSGSSGSGDAMARRASGSFESGKRR